MFGAHFDGEITKAHAFPKLQILKKGKINLKDYKNDA